MKRHALEYENNIEDTPTFATRIDRNIQVLRESFLKVSRNKES